MYTVRTKEPESKIVDGAYYNSLENRLKDSVEEMVQSTFTLYDEYGLLIRLQKDEGASSVVITLPDGREIAVSAYSGYKVKYNVEVR